MTTPVLSLDSSSNSQTIATPREWIESFADLRFPPKTDARLQWLMDRNSAGELQSTEREELESLVDMSEELSLLRAKARQLLQGL